ncbi:hypothetical protein R5R35_003639 [Gryllus longicercus]|uniref:N-acetyltransferase domain-containing protein n=1 Tax=Gryllus longicercus TaxID=2509291 RepID=A0AAN9ZAD3_9ORTH
MADGHGTINGATVWDRFNGTEPLIDGEQVPDIWIQDLTEELDEEVLQHLQEHFLRDAVLSRATRLLEHPDAVQEALAIWRHMLSQRVSLVALTIGEGGKPVIVGCNILSIKRRLDEPIQVRSAPLRVILEATRSVEARADVFARYGVDACLTALGLSVAPRFRGRGVGLRLLRARRPLCRALRLRLTATVFTGAAAQKQALRAGFEPLAQIRYAEYRDALGRPALAHADGDAFVYMAMPV